MSATRSFSAATGLLAIAALIAEPALAQEPFAQGSAPACALALQTFTSSSPLFVLETACPKVCGGGKLPDCREDQDERNPGSCGPSVAPGCAAALAAATPASITASVTAYAGVLSGPVCAGTEIADQSSQVLSLFQTPAFAQLYTHRIGQECAGTSTDGPPACIAADFNAVFGEGSEPKHSDCAALKLLDTASCGEGELQTIALYTADDCALIFLTEDDDDDDDDGPPSCIRAEYARTIGDSEPVESDCDKFVNLDTSSCNPVEIAFLDYYKTILNCNEKVYESVSWGGTVEFPFSDDACHFLDNIPEPESFDSVSAAGSFTGEGGRGRRQLYQTPSTTTRSSAAANSGGGGGGGGQAVCHVAEIAGYRAMVSAACPKIVFSIAEEAIFFRIFDDDDGSGDDDGAPSCIAAEFAEKFPHLVDPQSDSQPTHADCPTFQSLDTSACVGDDKVTIDLYLKDNCQLLKCLDQIAAVEQQQAESALFQQAIAEVSAVAATCAVQQTESSCTDPNCRWGVQGDGGGGGARDCVSDKIEAILQSNREFTEADCPQLRALNLGACAPAEKLGAEYFFSSFCGEPETATYTGDGSKCGVYTDAIGEQTHFFVGRIGLSAGGFCYSDSQADCELALTTVSQQGLDSMLSFASSGVTCVRAYQGECACNGDKTYDSDYGSSCYATDSDSGAYEQSWYARVVFDANDELATRLATRLDNSTAILEELVKLGATNNSPVTAGTVATLVQTKTGVKLDEAAVLRLVETATLQNRIADLEADLKQAKNAAAKVAIEAELAEAKGGVALPATPAAQQAGQGGSSAPSYTATTTIDNALLLQILALLADNADGVAVENGEAVKTVNGKKTSAAEAPASKAQENALALTKQQLDAATARIRELEQEKTAAGTTEVRLAAIEAELGTAKAKEASLASSVSEKEAIVNTQNAAAAAAGQGSSAATQSASALAAVLAVLCAMAW